MQTYIIIIQTILSCLFGGLAIIGILYPKLKNTDKFSAILNKTINAPVAQNSDNSEDINNDESVVDELSEFEKEFTFKTALIYGIISAVVTVASGLWLMFHFENGDILYMAKRVLLISVLFVAAYYDRQSYRIPNKLILYGLSARVIIFVFELIFSAGTLSEVLISEGIAVGALIILSVVGLIVMRNGIGMGDIKLFILMGALQGVAGVIPSIFASLIVSFFYSVFLLLTRKKSRKDFIAFAPCILVGTVISIFTLGV